MIETIKMPQLYTELVLIKSIPSIQVKKTMLRKTLKSVVHTTRGRHILVELVFALTPVGTI
jgi:hypothetical protein